MIKAIFATDLNGGMGYQGSLPWPHCRDDFLWFKQHTLNQIVIMGRNTWDDPKMPKPLPNRICYVITSRIIPNPPVSQLCGEYVDTIRNIQRNSPEKDVFIIGGPKIILDCLDLIEEIYLTTFRGQYKIDTKIDLSLVLKKFELVSTDHKSDCTHLIYKKHANIPK